MDVLIMDSNSPRKKLIEEAVSCSLCAEFYQSGSHEPITLQCGHTFCRTCCNTLAKMIKVPKIVNANDDAEDNDDDDDNDDGKKKKSGPFLLLKCPNCRKIHKGSLSVNYSLNIFATPSQSKIDSCVEHREEIRYWCCKCDVLLCNLCLDSGTHMTHDVKLAKAYVKQKKEAIVKKMEHFIEIMMEVDKNTTEIEMKDMYHDYIQLTQSLIDMYLRRSSVNSLRQDCVQFLNEVNKMSTPSEFNQAESKLKVLYSDLDESEATVTTTDIQETSEKKLDTYDAESDGTKVDNDYSDSASNVTEKSISKEVKLKMQQSRESLTEDDKSDDGTKESTSNGNEKTTREDGEIITLKQLKLEMKRESDCAMALDCASTCNVTDKTCEDMEIITIKQSNTASKGESDGSAKAIDNASTSNLIYKDNYRSIYPVANPKVNREIVTLTQSINALVMADKIDGGAKPTSTSNVIKEAKHEDIEIVTIKQSNTASKGESNGSDKSINCASISNVTEKGIYPSANPKDKEEIVTLKKSITTSIWDDKIGGGTMASDCASASNVTKKTKHQDKEIIKITRSMLSIWDDQVDGDAMAINCASTRNVTAKTEHEDREIITLAQSVGVPPSIWHDGKIGGSAKASTSIETKKTKQENKEIITLTQSVGLPPLIEDDNIGGGAIAKYGTSTSNAIDKGSYPSACPVADPNDKEIVTITQSTPASQGEKERGKVTDKTTRKDDKEIVAVKPCENESYEEFKEKGWRFHLDSHDGRLQLHSLICSDDNLLSFSCTDIEVFLVLSAGKIELGQVNIKLKHANSRNRQFLALCLGAVSNAAPIRHMTAERIVNHDAMGESLFICCHQKLSLNPYEEVPLKSGLVFVHRQYDAVSRGEHGFEICLGSNGNRKVTYPIGEVVSGMDVLQAAAKHNPINSVIVTHSGVVFPDIYKLRSVASQFATG